MAKTAYYKSWKEIDLDLWPWRHFHPIEIACRGNGEILVNYEAMDCLEKFRELVKTGVKINSAYRSEAHNKKVGGSPNSNHKKGIAFDVAIIPRLSREKIHECAKIAGFKGFGDYDRFVHIDIGNARYWDLRKKGKSND